MVNVACFCWVWGLEVFEEKCLYFMFMEESTCIVVGALGGRGDKWDVVDDEGVTVCIVFVISS